MLDFGLSNFFGDLSRILFSPLQFAFNIFEFLLGLLLPAVQA